MRKYINKQSCVCFERGRVDFSRKTVQSVGLRDHTVQSIMNISI